MWGEAPLRPVTERMQIELPNVQLSILSRYSWRATVNKKHSAIRCQGLIWSGAKDVTNPWQEVSPEGNKEKEVTVLEAALVGVPVRTGRLPLPALTSQRSAPCLTGLSSRICYTFPMVHRNLHTTGKSTREIPNTMKSPVTKENLVSPFTFEMIGEIWKLMQMKVKWEKIS